MSELSGFSLKAATQSSEEATIRVLKEAFTRALQKVSTLTTTKQRAGPSRQAIWKRKQRQLRRELATTELKIEPGAKLKQWPVTEKEPEPFELAVSGFHSTAGNIVATGTQNAATQAKFDTERDVSTSIIHEMVNSWPQSIGYRKFPEVKKRILDLAIWDMSKVSWLLSYSSLTTISNIKYR